jgi:hypothetical protein
VRLWGNRCRSSSGKLRCTFLDASQFADRAQHFQPVTERDPEVFKMLIGQVGKNRKINAIFGKRLCILGYTEFLEPISNRCIGGPPTDFPLSALDRQ